MNSESRFFGVVAAAVALLAVLAVMLWRLAQPATVVSTDGTSSRTTTTQLFMYCAAGMRPPVDEIVAEYQREYGVTVQLQFNGSNTLLSQLTVAKSGDLFLAADDTYLDLAREKGLIRETFPLATMRPVIVVGKGNPKKIRGIADLLRDDVTVALGNPDQAAIGRTTRRVLTEAGDWQRLNESVTRRGVFKPTVPEVANDVKLGSVDAGIVWNTTLALYDELEAISTPELDAGTALVSIGVVSQTTNPTATLRFARYLSASDKGLPIFRSHGYNTVDGDRWAETPELTFYCGAVNRRAVEQVIRSFELREGAIVNTVYNGCGVLTAQMRSLLNRQTGSGFPDTYMACDRYYLDTVQDLFETGTDVSDTQVVIAVPRGNPANIKQLQDLARPGVRVAIGQPEQCTIGVLTRNILNEAGIYDEVLQNVVTQTASSAMLVPTIATGSVDAILAYKSDTLAESSKVETIAISSPAATAVQPFAIALQSDHKYLGQRLLDALLGAKDQFEQAGFHFRGPAVDTRKAPTP